MNNTVHEVLEFVRENDVKFIRLGFCDIFGTQKSIQIMAGELEYAFKNGISFDAHAIIGFRDIVHSDLLLFPDPTTMVMLPWRPGPGRVMRFFCDIRNPNGSAFSKDCRFALKRVVERAQKMGYNCKMGAECEFYLFKLDENGKRTTPLDCGGYLDIAPLDKGQDIRREICLTLEEMGIQPETSLHERGPGQNEIGFKLSEALECADNLQTFKTVVKTIAARHGLDASFKPKPLSKAAGNALHINLSLVKDSHSSIVESFIAGVLAKTPEITLFLNPIENSYERFGEFEAPKYVSWSCQNRSQLVRIPVAENSWMELRSPDTALNPYIAFALIISAGLDGMESNTALPPAVNVDLCTADESVTKSLTPLPNSFEKSISLAKGSAFAKNVLGEELFEQYVNNVAEWGQWIEL